MGKLVILVGLIVLALEGVAVSARDFAPLGLGLVIAGGFLHVRQP